MIVQEFYYTNIYVCLLFLHCFIINLLSSFSPYPQNMLKLKKLLNFNKNLCFNILLFSNGLYFKCVHKTT